MQEETKTKLFTKPSVSVKNTPIYYYLLTFIYLSVAIFLGLLGFKINYLGENRFSLKVFSLFLIFLLISLIIIPSFILYFLIVFTFCTFAFLYIDKSGYFSESKFNFYTGERWNDAISAGKVWFRFGLAAAVIALFIAIFQVQVFQGGRGGLNEQYSYCAQVAQDGSNTCLLSVALTRPIGLRLSQLINIYSGQAFLWGGLVFVLIKHGSNLNKSITYLIEKRKNSLAKKTEKITKIVKQ